MTANVISKRFHEEYRRSLLAIPTREAEYVYVERAKRGDRAAKDRLLYKYIPFLYKMAYQLRESAYNLTVDEMVNAAIFGFPKALKEFDSSLGLLFYTYYSAKAGKPAQVQVVRQGKRGDGSDRQGTRRRTLHHG